MKKSQSNLNKNDSIKKSQKVLGGVPKYNALPDRVHPVKITCESDGRRQGHMLDYDGRFSPSSKFDSQIPCEDSSTLKRKSIHLSSGQYKTDEFGIPIDAFPISVMSRTEGMGLRKRLIVEQEQTKSLSQKVENREIQLKSSGSVPTVSDGYDSRIPQKDQTVSKHRRCVKTSKLSNDKIPPAETQKPKGGGALTGGVKRGPQGRFKPRIVKKQKIDLAQKNLIANQMKQCATLLNKLMTHSFGSLFNEPVDPVKYRLPNYFRIIKNPMDLGTIKTRLETKYYSSPLDFAKDVRLTFSNATTYNPSSCPIHPMAVSLSEFFENEWKDIEKKLAGEEVYRKTTQGVQLIPSKKQPPNNKMTELESKSPRASNVNLSSVHSDRTYSLPTEKKPNIESCKEPKAESCKCVIPPEARDKLANDIELLAEDVPDDISDFLRTKNVVSVSQGSDEVELDLLMLDADGFWELQRLVTTYLVNNGPDVKNSRAAMRPPDQLIPSKKQPPSNKMSELESKSARTSNVKVSSVNSDRTYNLPTEKKPNIESCEEPKAEPCKCVIPPEARDKLANDIELLAEDVPDDISDFLRTKNAVSVSQGSDEVELDLNMLDADGFWELQRLVTTYLVNNGQDVKNSRAAMRPPDQENVECTAGSKQTGQSDPETTGAKRAVSVLDEEGAHPKTTASDADTHQQGESAQPERQVSADKLERVALLKNRFADTIFNAQEKTHNQVNRGDPAKLQREREQLEKCQREEKGRLQAEAKKAEGVRKKAEAEAAAEAIRKIELERAVARQALQNMEKSVEIYHDNQILKDLERMGCAAPDHIPNSGDGTSPVNSLDGLGNFPLQGKNPLSNLGYS